MPRGVVTEGHEAERRAQLSGLPDAVLQIIMCHLGPRDLASLAVQNHHLKRLAEDGLIWRTLCKRRWTCNTAQHFGNNWKRMYGSRMTLPTTFITCVDRAHITTQVAADRLGRNKCSAQKESSWASERCAQWHGGGCWPVQRAGGFELEEVMQMVFSIGLLVGCCGPRLKGCRDLQLHRADVAWWLAHRPEVVVLFARHAVELAGECDGWSAGGAEWPDVPWRRSSLQFVLDMGLGMSQGVHPSVLDRLHRECGMMDSRIRSLEAQAVPHSRIRMGGGWQRPMGLPASHWWYYPPSQRMAAHV